MDECVLVPDVLVLIAASMPTEGTTALGELARFVHFTSRALTAHFRAGLPARLQWLFDTRQRYAYFLSLAAASLLRAPPPDFVFSGNYEKTYKWFVTDLPRLSRTRKVRTVRVGYDVIYRTRWLVFLTYLARRFQDLFPWQPVTYLGMLSDDFFLRSKLPTRSVKKVSKLADVQSGSVAQSSTPQLVFGYAFKLPASVGECFVVYGRQEGIAMRTRINVSFIDYGEDDPTVNMPDEIANLQ